MTALRFIATKIGYQTGAFRGAPKGKRETAVKSPTQRCCRKGNYLPAIPDTLSTTCRIFVTGVTRPNPGAGNKHQHFWLILSGGNQEQKLVASLAAPGDSIHLQRTRYGKERPQVFDLDHHNRNVVIVRSLRFSMCRRTKTRPAHRNRFADYCANGKGHVLIDT
jgi:hypothetical protein